MKENVIPFPGARDKSITPEEEIFCLRNSAGEPVPFQWVTGIQYKGVPYAVLHPVEEDEDVVAIFQVDETGEETVFRDNYDSALQAEVFDFFCSVWERERNRRDDPGEYLILFDGEGNSQPMVQVDEIPYRGERYAVLFSIDPNDHDAVILRRVGDELEEVEDDTVVQKVYRIFRQRNAGRFHFEDGEED